MPVGLNEKMRCTDYRLTHLDVVMQKYEFLDPGCFITTIFKILSILEFEFSQGPVSKNLIGRRVIYLFYINQPKSKIHTVLCVVDSLV